MKKVLSLIVLLVMLILPLSVKAAYRLVDPFPCTTDSDNNITCKINYEITGTEGYDTVTIKLTEQGGAKIDKITNDPDGEWTISGTPTYSNGVWTVTVTSPGTTGEGTFFQITYKASGLEGCGILVEPQEGSKVTITPENPDKPTDNKDTGATLPFIALGSIALVAVGAYLVTKNKTKMYKI